MNSESVAVGFSWHFEQKKNDGVTWTLELEALHSFIFIVSQDVPDEVPIIILQIARLKNNSSSLAACKKFELINHKIVEECEKLR